MDVTKALPQPALPVDAFSLLDHGVCVFDGDRRIVSWNARLEKLGVPAGQVEGRALLEILQSYISDARRLMEAGAAVVRALGEQKSTLLRQVAVDFPARPGQTFNVAVVPVAGEAPQGALVFQNVTESERLRDYFETILDSTPDGIFIIDKDRRVLLFNRACGYITGRPPDEIMHLGPQCGEVMRCHTEEGESYAESLCPAKAIFRGREGNSREEMLLTNADGAERWVETTYSPIRNDSGQVEYVISILRDVHERKMLEERLHQSEKLASLGQLVAGIAHEIKNPLAIMLTSLDIIGSPSRPAEQKAEATEFLREEIKRLDDRLRAFLAFARPRPLELRPTVLSGLLRRAQSSMTPLFPEIDLNVEILRPEPIIMGDPEALNQVLTNLVFNAADAMGGNGKITLRLRPKGDTAIMEVEDAGPGVPEDLLSRIFDPFFTTRAEGTGLGLSICYQIILGHRGNIAVRKGKDGKGACFSVALPMATKMEVETAG